MNAFLGFLGSILLLAAGIAVMLLLTRLGRMRVTVRDFERGLLYRSGRFVRVLAPGGHWLPPFHSARVLDVRSRLETVPGQEVLTRDRAAIRASLLLRYRVADPANAEHNTASFVQALYAEAQIALRDLVGGVELEELMAIRAELGGRLAATLGPRAAAIGLELESAGLKDLTFPPHLRQAFHQVIEAKQAALASLERARGESATLRHLANAARMLENNPALVTLKALQVTSAGPHTFVLGVPGAGVTSAGVSPPPTPGSEAGN